MKVIRITPGLGNQMFQYAFILNYKLRGEKIALDTTPCLNSKKHNGYELERIFGIKEHILTPWEKFKINGPYFYFKEREITFLKLVNKIRKKIFDSKTILSFRGFLQEKDSSEEFNFYQSYLNLSKDLYIVGYFTSWRYFDDIKKEVFDIFSFLEIKKEDLKNFRILEKIKNTESVSLHIRRGDYIKYNNLNILDIKYFKNSFNFVLKKLLKEKIAKECNISFFVFSDDIEWCKENLDFLKDFDVNYVDWNKENDSYKDMQLMSECKHNIISNSTFSWWGGYLNKNKNKIVCAPSHWYLNIKTSCDKIPKEWYIIANY